MSLAFLFAHGAGAPSSSPWMQHYAALLGRFGRVEAFDYPYMASGKRAPDRLPKLIEAHRVALAGLRATHSGPIVLAGKSMGGRVGCHLALEEPCAAVICFGYPLVGTRGARRDEVLKALTRPVFFAQGTRDKLCPLPLLDEVRAQMTAQNEAYIVETGDHSLLATKTHLKQHGLTQAQMDEALMERVGAFLARIKA